MPRIAEIADSDEEGDVDVAPLPQPPSLPRTDQVGTIPDVDLGVNFSDFLSQSQRRDMNDTEQSLWREEQAAHTERAETSTGTTASLQRQIESEQRKFAEQKTSSTGRLSNMKKSSDPHSSDSPIVAKTKRRHSELATKPQMDGERDTKPKRQNTYGSSSSRRRSSQTDLFADEHRIQDADDMAERASSIIVEDSSNQLEDHGPLIDQQAAMAGEGLQFSHQNCPTEASAALDTQTDISDVHFERSTLQPDPFKEYMQMSSGRISTSRSLMGNYESINLDFRSSRPGADIYANPFLDASQQSVEDCNSQTERERFAAIFRPPPVTNPDTVPFSNKRDTYTPDLVQLHQHGTDGAMSLRSESASQLGSGRSKSFVDPSLLTEAAPDDAPELFDSKPSSSRKRRKTADGLAFGIASTDHEVDRLPAAVTALDASPPRVETQGKKRGRKPKNHHVEPVHENQIEQLQGQGDDINDEMHAKHPSSDLHLNDESAVGLPQEQYKPRPSRSRSKRTGEDEMPPPAHSPVKSVHTPVKQVRTPSADDTVQLDEPEDTPLTKLKKDKKRKNKMKRAKTSAAALLKKSDKMLSDGEEDVVWVESKPATVKMKVPDPIEVKEEESLKAETKAPKKTEGGPTNTIHVAVREQSPRIAPEEAPEISVDIPHTEGEPSKPPPKKRGRKKKQPVDIELPGPINHKDNSTEHCTAAAEPPDDTTTEHEDTPNPPRPRTSSSRLPLKGKDINTTLHATAAREVNTETDDAATEPVPTKTPATTPSPSKLAQNENKASETQPQSKSTESSSDRGPTKHSPINPAGGKVRYRVGLSRRAAIPPLLKIVRK